MEHVIELWPEGAPHAMGESEEDRPALTPYLLGGSGNSAVIVCPGGGYQRRAAHEGDPVAEWLNGIGVSAFVLRYRVAPYQYPAGLLDAQRAIRTVRSRAAEFGIDPSKVGILGFSAGGHLAATAGTHFDAGQPESQEAIEQQSCRPEAMILCYPVITLKPPYAHMGSRQTLLGDRADDEKLVDLLSNDEQVTAGTPPTFLWHTADDASVPVENSLQFAAALRRHEVPFDLHVYTHGRHGLGLALDHPHASGWTKACADWLRGIGFAPVH